MWEMAHSLLTQLEFDKNLLELPEGVLRVMQLIFDGHGWTSRCGTVRFTLRCVHTIEDHNSTRNARDPIFALGTDKCADIAKVITVGGERSMQERMYKGLVIRQRAVEDLPWWVQEDTDFLNLACYECACYVLTFFVCVFGIYIYIFRNANERNPST